MILYEIVRGLCLLIVIIIGATVLTVLAMVAGVAWILLWAFSGFKRPMWKERHDQS